MSNSYWMKIDHFPALQCFETSVSILLICALFSRPSLGLDKDTPLLCSQKGHTMRVEAQICVPTGSTSGEEFTKASVDNCNKLKDGCQEFNEATCICCGSQLSARSEMDVLQQPASIDDRLLSSLQGGR
uniref:Uncharacterized protein n=1 Tax=Cacopsylla melanoneura TaxID=428564 RepID=A0A8D8M1T5_9HEMI